MANYKPIKCKPAQTKKRVVHSNGRVIVFHNKVKVSYLCLGNSHKPHSKKGNKVSLAPTTYPANAPEDDKRRGR